MRDQFDDSEESSFYGPLGSDSNDLPPSYDQFADEYGGEGYDNEEEEGRADTVSAQVPSDENSAPFPSPLPLDKAFESAAPVLLVSRPAQKPDLIAPLLRVIARAEGSDVVLGAIAPLHHVTPEHGSRFLAGCDAASLRIADPFSFAFFDSVSGRKAPSRRRWPYQQEGTLSSTSDEMWVNEVVHAQRAAGANVILSPGRFLSGNDSRRELDNTIAHSELTAEALLPGEVSAVNLTISIHWLNNDVLRDELLARINEHAPRVLYVRVLWNKIDTAGQPLDIELLRGYRELCEVTRSEGIALLLPDTDLTGWMTLAWGAVGFGTGITSGARAFMASGGGGGANMVPKERFLERSLLHTILRAEHFQLLRAGQVEECVCTYCRMAHSGSPWIPEIQGSHHVCTVAALAADTHRVSGRAAPGRLKAIVDSVNTAKALANKIVDEIALDPASQPKHLTPWQTVLSDSEA